MSPFIVVEGTVLNVNAITAITPRTDGNDKVIGCRVLLANSAAVALKALAGDVLLAIYGHDVRESE